MVFSDTSIGSAVEDRAGSWVKVKGASCMTRKLV